MGVGCTPGLFGEPSAFRRRLGPLPHLEVRLGGAHDNAGQPSIGPEHLCRDAVVFDIAVPMNTRPEVERLRPDVLVIQGGIVSEASRANLTRL